MATPVVNTNLNTQGGGRSKYSDAIQSYIGISGKDGSGNPQFDGHAIQKNNPNLWQWAKDHWGGKHTYANYDSQHKATGGSSTKEYSDSDIATVLAGYEQWIENQGLDIVKKCQDDLGKNNG